MHTNSRAAVTGILLAFAVSLLAQAPPRVPTEQALASVVKRLEPVAPAIAVAAKVGGPVASDVVIRADGTVESVTVIAGPVLLHQATIDALRQWTFKPILVRGKPTRVVTFIEVRFPDLARDEARATYDAYASAVNQCQRHLESSPAPVAEQACADAADRADELSPDRVLERSRARALFGIALLRNDRARPALDQFERAVAERRRVTKNADADLAENLEFVGIAHARLGNTQMADESFAQSIRMMEAAIEALPDYRSRYLPRLQASLRRYADVKRAMGDAQAAQDLEAKATGLSLPASTPEPRRITVVDGLQCLCAGGWPSPADVREIRLMLPTSARPIWLIVSHGPPDDPARNIQLYLEPDETAPRYRRGRTLHVQPEHKPAPSGRRWNVAEIPLDYIQVPTEGMPGPTLGSTIDSAFPIQLAAYPSATPLRNDDILSLIDVVRGRAKAQSAASPSRPRLYTDVQTWPIAQILNTGTSIEVFLTDPAQTGRGQHLSLRRAGTTWTIVTISAIGG
jgi:tetratricopeptide (TPR) repeat protein